MGVGVTKVEIRQANYKYNLLIIFTVFYFSFFQICVENFISRTFASGVVVVVVGFVTLSPPTRTLHKVFGGFCCLFCSSFMKFTQMTALLIVCMKMKFVHDLPFKFCSNVPEAQGNERR